VLGSLVVMNGLERCFCKSKRLGSLLFTVTETHITSREKFLCVHDLAGSLGSHVQASYYMDLAQLKSQNDRQGYMELSLQTFTYYRKIGSDMRANELCCCLLKSILSLIICTRTSKPVTLLPTSSCCMQ
jgi:hypothetical protein